MAVTHSNHQVLGYTTDNQWLEAIKDAPCAMAWKSSVQFSWATGAAEPKT